MAFRIGRTSRVIHAASPRRDRWKDWQKYRGSVFYFMGVWGVDELKALASKIKSSSYLTLLLEAQISNTIAGAATAFATDPMHAFSNVLTMDMGSVHSSIVWMRPETKHGLIISRRACQAFVPHLTEVVEQLHRAFCVPTAAQRVASFQQLSWHAGSRSIAGDLLEGYVHMSLTAGGNHFDWFTRPTKAGGQLTPVAHPNVAAHIKSAQVPFYFCPDKAGYAGIDGALCTEDCVYAMQSTLDWEHESTQAVLEKLSSELAPENN
ncbi:uncharacterized protein FIBRA_02187 [Fibroporia radiculosa]|uniref:Uncharacterized protein n=1 Tax=Fibroporia radiculosa TaxID=599839 RepID=J4H1Q0_9APHY|nr:uncharacterized protein FIBRA_02187 [Fibroporia radiculosa]CCM00159.1 predicted protein [Fibroporia radiculosa]